MEKQKQIAKELEQQINEAGKNPFAKGFIAPLRLLMVWIKNTNERLDSMEKRINP